MTYRSIFGTQPETASKAKRNAGRPDQTGLQGMWVRMRYEKHIKQGKPEHTGTAWMQLPQQVFSMAYNVHGVKLTTKDEKLQYSKSLQVATKALKKCW